MDAHDTATADFLARAENVLRETFGFEAFRDGQKRVLEAVGDRRDTLVIMPTGSGKSLCYQVPAIVQTGVTLVVSPLIALMKDQVDSLELRGVPVTFINSSLTPEEERARLDGIQSGLYRLVYVAPERFRNRRFRRVLSGMNIELLAIDEAHCISQWGHDFRPDYRRLKDVRQSLGEVPVIALTATATPEVQNDIAQELAMRDEVRVVTGFDRPNLAYRVIKASSEARKYEVLLDFLRPLYGGGPTGSPNCAPGIVYTGTRKHAEEVAGQICAEFGAASGGGRPLCRAYHAGLPDDERRGAQEDFMEGTLPCVAATNAFGMGVDKADIRFVVHFDLPGSIESYYQEVGRAGRDGEPADCVLLFSERDRYLQEFFIEGSNPDRRIIESVHDLLWSFDENPIFRTLDELEQLIDGAPWMDGRVNPMAVRSAMAILERFHAIERLDHFDNLAEVTPLPETNWEANPFSERATVKGTVWSALQGLFRDTDGEPVALQLESWAGHLDIAADALRATLHQFARDGLIRYIPPFRGRATRLPPVRQTLEEIGVDFEALRKRRERDEQRLQEMLSFARTRECRRNRLLRHFGEVLPEKTCGFCDRCSKRKKPTSEETVAGPLNEEQTVIVRKVLSGVARARGRCGRQRVIQMLLGSAAQGVVGQGLDKLSTHGLLKGADRGALRDLLDGLEEAGCVRQQGDRYPKIHLTPKGVAIMKGEEVVELCFPPLFPTRGPTRGELGRAIDDGDEPFDEELFQELRTVRRRIADELAVPAFRVFTDRTLKAMARHRPQSEAELLLIPGVGERTLERFGAEFITACAEFGGS